MTDWKKQYEDGIAAVQRECKGGARFKLHVLPASSLFFDGDAHPNIKQAVAEWLTGMDKAWSDGYRPACVACSRELARGQVRAFVVCLPVEDDGRTGMTGVLCRKCLDLGETALAASLIKAISEVYRADVKVEHLH